jgi:hypothetical protein
MKGGELFLGMAGGNWGRAGAPQHHHQPSADPPCPDSTDPWNLACFNATPHHPVGSGWPVSMILRSMHSWIKTHTDSSSLCQI